jgi:hypothetical protein
MGVPPLGCGQEVTMAVLPRGTVTFLFTDTWCGSHEGRLIPAAVACRGFAARQNPYAQK